MSLWPAFQRINILWIMNIQDMSRVTRVALWWALCMLPAGAMAQEGCPEQVRVSFLDYDVPPWFNGAGAEFPDPPGHVVVWIQKAIAQTNCPTKLKLLRRPVKRFYLELEQGTTDIVAMSPATPERLASSAFPLRNGQIDTRLTYLSTETSLWVRKGDQAVQWDGHTLRGPEGFKVGVSSGQSSEALARKQGWGLELGVNGVNVIDKLLAGRSHVILLPDITVAASPSEKQVLMQRLLPSLEQTLFFSPANKQFHAHYPGFMARYWEALCQISRAEPALPMQKKLPACR